MARKEFKFWLNDKLPGDWQLNELISQLKAARQFSRAIRDGLRLWADLAGGGVSVLLELHPDIRERLGVAQKPAPDPNGGGGLDEINSKLELLLAQQASNGGYLMQSNNVQTYEQPKLEVTSAAVDTDAIFDDFMSFIQ